MNPLPHYSHDSSKPLVIECNCAHTPPTMPTCRDKHSSTCPMALVEKLNVFKN